MFVLDNTTSFEIKSQPIKTFTYFGILLLAPLTLIWNLLIFKGKKRKIITSILPLITLIGILIVGPIKIAFSSSAWKTQTVISQNEHLNYKKVEFQMRDMGALGYRKRTVEVTYLTKLFMIVKPAKKNFDKRTEWIMVNKEINELGIKN